MSGGEVLFAGTGAVALAVMWTGMVLAVRDAC